ncbi:unnamed protein product, partial [Rotaria sp. Silwood2]
TRGYIPRSILIPLSSECCKTFNCSPICNERTPSIVQSKLYNAT